MTDDYTDMLAKRLPGLSAYKADAIRALVPQLQSNDLVEGVLLGGSLSYKKDTSRSDVDLFCLINDVKLFEAKLSENISNLDDIDDIICQGNFPWTGKLYTIYFNQDMDFSVDLCLIDINQGQNFFWEPDALILFDKEQLLARFMADQLNNPNFTRQPFLKENPFLMAVVTLKKIEKNLIRNHLWNALEHVNTLRRYIIQIYRLEIVNDVNFLGRPDRDVEDVMQSSMNTSLTQTVALYDKKDIARKTVLLIEILQQLKTQLKAGYGDAKSEWILKQLRYELSKLQFICDYA